MTIQHPPQLPPQLPPEGMMVAHQPFDDTRRREIRASLRHPLENLTLIVAVIASVTVMGVSIYSLIDALREDRAPGIYTLLFSLAPLVLWLVRGQLMARLRVSSVKITPTQYPQAYAMVQEAAAFFGMKRAPDAYVVLGNGAINAAASGHGFRRFIFIYSDLFEVGGRLKNPDALRFIIGHEVGHIAAGHASYWRWLGTFGAQILPFIRRQLRLRVVPPGQRPRHANACRRQVPQPDRRHQCGRGSRRAGEGLLRLAGQRARLASRPRLACPRAARSLGTRPAGMASS